MWQSVCPPFRMKNSAPNWGFRRNFYIFNCFLNVCRDKSRFIKMTQVTSSLDEDFCKFMTMSLWNTLRMINISDKFCRENQKYFKLNYFSDNITVYGIIWKNILQPDRPQITIQLRHNPFACCVHMATDTHADYVMLFCYSTAKMDMRAPLSFV